MDLIVQERVLTTNPALFHTAPQRDLDTFNHQVTAYRGSLFNLALRILGDGELAADATQEALILAYRKINGFHGGSFKAWLLRIVTNVCYDELRRQKRHPTVPLDLESVYGEEMDAPRWLADPSMSPEEKVEAAELERTIQDCLDALPMVFRAAVVLVDVQGMNYHEAAYAAQVPLGTIKSRLARARMRLRDSLQGYLDHPQHQPQEQRIGVIHTTACVL